MHSRPIPFLVILLILLLSGCGSPQAAPAVVVQEPTATPKRATPTPRQPTATPKPTPRPADPTDVPPEPSAVPPTTEPTPEPPPAATAVVVNGGNVRITPVTGTPLDQVHAHETVRLVGANADASWYLLVTPRNVTGWVSATLLRVDTASAGQVPVVPETTEGKAASSPASGEWTTHPVKGGSIGLPSNWQTVSLSKEELERMATEMEALNSSHADYMRRLIESGQFSQLRFLALDPVTESNINMLAFPRPGEATPDKLLDQLVGGASGSLPGMKLISADSKHHVNGLPAGRTVYDLTESAPDPTKAVRGVQWYIITGSEIVIITVTGPANDALITVADQIGKSFTAQGAAGESAPTGERRQVINGGNLRRAPQVSASNVIGQVCPGDHVALLDQPDQPQWAMVRIEVTGPDCDPSRAPAGAEGWVSTTLLGPVAQDGAAALPPSLLITRLVPFTHEPTGITGLRPENWTLFETGPGFQISSSPEAPDGFIAMFVESTDYGSGGPEQVTRAMFEEFKRNHAAGPEPEILEEKLNPDGSGVLLAAVSGQAQGSTQSVRMMIYARSTITSRGPLLAVALVPADLFPKQETLIRQMVDSVRLKE